MSLASTPSELPLTGRRIVLGITGSIAAYKSAVLARELRRRGAEVRVVMTPGATEFITPLTLATLVDHPVHSDFTEDEHAGVWTNHVELGIWGDLILVAPATANTLAAMVHGGCDNLLQAVLLSARCPVAVAPAMDLDMFSHEATQSNLQTLADRGVRVIEPGTGPLASGLHGKGRMAEPEEIADEVAAHFASDLPWAGKNVLITAGPTHEPMDAVRFLGNRSSGKMGFALAEVLANAGAQVTLVAGPVHLATPDRVHARIDVQTAIEMNDAVQQRWTDMDWGIACAAVSDFRPAQTSAEKWHRGDMPEAVELAKTPTSWPAWATTNRNIKPWWDLRWKATMVWPVPMEKWTRKNLDAIVLNSLKDDGAGFGHDTNKVSVHFRDGKSVSFELKSKYEVAQDLVELWRTTLNT